ncbi:MAG: hypothetical protein GYA02_01090 [Clostridiaceae bacterium]|nr:hypothetical protein [Clostridiaceae bacterium]
MISVSAQSIIAGSFFAAEAMKKAGINQIAPEFANEFSEPGRHFCSITGLIVQVIRCICL